MGSKTKNNVAEDLNKNFENGLQHTDVTIELVDGEIKVHKFVLSSRSAYFTAMFQEDKFIEAGRRESCFPIFPLYYEYNFTMVLWW